VPGVVYIHLTISYMLIWTRVVGDQKTVLTPLSLIIVMFGGGTRSSESIADPEHRYIPRLWKEMTPQGTLWTNMRVEHRLVHPNSAWSIMTGHREWDDLDWSKPPVHPAIFEIVRKHGKLPDT
jgi:hypothetical protein